MTGLIHHPLIWSLTLLNLATMAIVGICASAFVWFLTEGLKERYPVVRRSGITPRLPLILGLALAGIFFGPALRGVQPDHTAGTLTVLALTICAGIAGGWGARLAHDKFRRLMELVFGWAARKLGGD